MARKSGQAVGESASPAAKKGRRDNARIIVSLIGLVLLVAFVLDNSQKVSVGFVFVHAHVRLIWVLLIAAVLGAAVDRLIILLLARRKKAKSPPV